MSQHRKTDVTRVTEFRIDPVAGSICIGNTVRLVAYQDVASVEASITPWLTGSRDLDNGYRWLTLSALTFGGRPADLSLCFEENCLWMALWSVSMPESRRDDWPTQETNEAEVAFVRKTLSEHFELTEQHWPPTDFAWGTLWSYIDPRNLCASSGLSYREPRTIEPTA